MKKIKRYKNINVISKINNILVIFLIISIYLFSTNDKYNIYYKLIASLFIGYNLAIILLRKKYILLNFYVIRWIIFSLFCLLSLTWANIIYYDIVIVLFLITAILLAFTNYVTSINEYRIVLNGIVFAGVLLCIYIFSQVGLNELISGRLVLDGYNSNDIGMKLVFSSMCCIYFIVNKTNSKLNTVILLVILPFIFFTNSKKAILNLVIGVTIYFIINSRNPVNFIKNILISGIFFVVFWWIIFNIDWFYNAIGIRFEKLISQLLMGAGGSDSDQLRMLFIQSGLNYAKNKPLIGYGVNNFRNITLFNTYSHNNYIELLVGVGSMGLLLFYSNYLWVIIALFKRYKINRSIVSFSFTVVIIIVLMEFAMVTYNEVFYALMICLSYSTVKIVGLETYDRRVNK